jgi:hypothetical protein
MKASTHRTVALSLLVTHWLAELLPLQDRAALVARLTVLSVETLWVWWAYHHRLKRHRPTGHPRDE